MRQPAFIVATLTGSLLFGASVASVAGAMRGTALPAVPAATAPAARVAQVDIAPRPQALALAEAIRQQFPGHAVDVAFVAPLLAGGGPSQEEVQALASIRIDGSAPMTVRMAALYDREARSVDAPSLWFEAEGAQPATEPLRRALAAATTQRLGAEFAGQPFAVTLGDASAARVGGRYLRVVAHGATDFGTEGRAATTVEALYDPRNDEWLRLDYALGADPADARAGDDGFAYAAP